MNSLLQYKAKISMRWISLTGILLLCGTLFLANTAQAADETQTDHQVLKDPTMPLFSHMQGKGAINPLGKKEEKEKVSLVLQGIVIKSGQKFAVINGQVLSEGKSIEGFEIAGIFGDKVLLHSGSEELALTLHKVNIKHSND